MRFLRFLPKSGYFLHPSGAGGLRFGAKQVTIQTENRFALWNATKKRGCSCGKQQRRRAERGTHLRTDRSPVRTPQGRVPADHQRRERPAQKHGAPAALQPCIAGLRGAGQFLHALSADDEDVRAVQRHRQRYGYHVRCKAASGQAFPPYGRGGASGHPGRRGHRIHL